MISNNIYAIYGDNPKSMVKEVLSKIKIEEEIDKDALIGIKPNLVVAKPSSSGATTSPDLVEGVIQYLLSKGYKNLVILEGSWVGDSTTRAFKVCGYEKFSRQYGIPLIDLQKDSFQEYYAQGLKINVCEKAVKVDYLINMPVLKGHCQTRMTCALKNIKGCIPDKEKRRFHTMGLHKPIAYLNLIVKSSLVVVDGIMGDLCFEEGGTPVQMNRVIAGKDPVLIDAYVAELMGYCLDDIPYIGIAEDIGVGSANLSKANIIELNKDNNIGKIIPSRKVDYLAKYIDEREACSACYGSLIHALKRLDDKGKLNSLCEKIYIGQGYKNEILEGIGVGLCTKNFSSNIPGCPPKAKDIVECIMKEIERKNSRPQ